MNAVIRREDFRPGGVNKASLRVPIRPMGVEIEESVIRSFHVVLSEIRGWGHVQEEVNAVRDEWKDTFEWDLGIYIQI
jgi:hypothetical protein